MIGHLEISSARDLNIDFSQPYNFSYSGVISNKNNMIKGQDELNGKKIAYIIGDIADKEWLRENVKNVQLVTLDNEAQVIQALKVGQIDGFLAFRETAMIYCKINSDIVYSEFGIDEGGIGIGVKKNSSLLPKINQAILII